MKKTITQMGEDNNYRCVLSHCWTRTFYWSLARYCGPIGWIV